MAGSDKYFDVIVAGGHVLDPGAGIEGDYDLGITDGRITAVAAALTRGPTTRIIDARDHIVTPGLVDLHTHVYWGATYWGIEADPVAARSGVRSEEHTSELQS